jgi:anti-sigma B factor antagonist
MTTAEFSTQVEAGQLVLTVRGEIDIANIGAFESALTALTARADGHRLVVDATGLTYLDSVGIKALMRAQRRYDHGSRIALRNVTPAVRRVLELTVPDMFDLV